MELAARFKTPIITFVDTPGAYPGIGAEERGQAEAIARNLREMARFRVPIIVTVIGEGGSGGALAIGVGDRVLMMEYSVYSVISPEGCAAILWRDGAQAPDAAARGHGQDALSNVVGDSARVANTSLRVLPEGGQNSGLQKPPESVLRPEVEVKSETGQRVLCVPMVRQVGSEQHQIPCLERADVVADQPRAGTLGDEYDFQVWMAVPSIARSLVAIRSAVGANGLHVGHILSVPSHKTERLSLSHADRFDLGFRIQAAGLQIRRI